MVDEFDILIIDGLIIDGTGRPAFRGSVGVGGDRIKAIGAIVKGDAKIVINARNLAVTPGFIDAHSHADKTLPIFPTADSYVAQGVTTTVGGNCGNTIAPIEAWWPPNMFWDLDIIHELRPFKYDLEELIPAEEARVKIKEVYGVDITWGSFSEFLNWLRKTGISINHAPLVGHNTIKTQVMGLEEREPSREELREMGEHVREAMESGAFGLSTGLDYVPGAYSTTEELIELSKIVKEYGGLYVTHWRRTGPRKAGARAPIEKIKGIEEAIEIAEKAGVSTQISHLTYGYTIHPQPPPSELEDAAVKATLRVIDAAISRGIDVHFDVIPNTTGGTLTIKYLASLLAPWLRETSSREALAKALRMKDFREEVKDAISRGKWYSLNPNVNPYWPRDINLVKCNVKEFEGKSLSHVAMEKGVDPLDVLFDILTADPNTIIKFNGAATDGEIALFLRHPRCMVGLDVYVFDNKWEMKGPPQYLPHPNTYGGMAKYLRRYVREMKVISAEEAILKATSLPANKFKIKDRGVLQTNAYADIVIFDFNEITDVKDPLEPRRYPKGIHYVIVNGEIVIEQGKHTGRRPGRVLTRTN